MGEGEVGESVRGEGGGAVRSVRHEGEGGVGDGEA